MFPKLLLATLLAFSLAAPAFADSDVAPPSWDRDIALSHLYRAFDISRAASSATDNSVTTDLSSSAATTGSLDLSNPIDVDRPDRVSPEYFSTTVEHAAAPIPVSEAASLPLFGVGLLTLAYFRRKR